MDSERRDELRNVTACSNGPGSRFIRYIPRSASEFLDHVRFPGKESEGFR